MAKKRERPPTNPLQRDLVANISNPVRPPASPAEPTPAPDANPPAGQGAEPSGNGVKEPPPALFPKSRPLPTRQRQTVTMKTRFAAAESAENGRVVDRLKDILGRDESKLTESHVTRAVWSLVRRAEDEFEAIAGKAPSLRRPAHGDHLGSAEYEDALADFILSALKRMRRDG